MFVASLALAGVPCAGADAPAPSASCSVRPNEVIVGQPVSASVTVSNFNPAHPLSYLWKPGVGGKVLGNEATAEIATTDAAPGSYSVIVHVTDAKARKNNEATCTVDFVVKPAPTHPPNVVISANPGSVPFGGAATLWAKCSSPDGAEVIVSDWKSVAGTVAGSGYSAILNTEGVSPGVITVSATCTDSRGQTALATTEVAVESPPPPPPSPEIKAVEARLALQSIYFATSMPPVENPKAGLVESQRQTLLALAADFRKYLESKPEARLLLEGHADPRGRVQYDEKLSERRADRVKSFLVEQGIPESSLDTKAYGALHALTETVVKDTITHDPELSSEERHRALRNIETIVLASDRRVDITLSTTGEGSLRRFPFNAEDALTLIGGREAEAKKRTGKRTVRSRL